MKGQLKASTPEEYIEQLAEPRKSEIAALDAMMRKAAPKARRFIQDGILAYGSRAVAARRADGAFSPAQAFLAATVFGAGRMYL